ncbi:hypothetical protein RN001_002228 [Aquatica leii]|uniref:Uncharacterized protein n=1 Tax=Aquatica leii TaxID=1421715 RepID=A0AAN7PGT2_9COLE|nr:hypothetical protein RN001_002228 [Aquatica leii]
MALVADLLKELKPPTWTNENYTNQRYVKVPLPMDSQEYREILLDFKSKYSFDVVRISRIQHPFAFCRFKLRQTHLFLNRGTLPKEKRHYVSLHSNGNLHNFLKNNCDSRCNAKSNSYSNTKYVIVAKTFKDEIFDERDSHRFPEYLIESNITSVETSFNRLNI